MAKDAAVDMDSGSPDNPAGSPPTPVVNALFWALVVVTVVVLAPIVLLWRDVNSSVAQLRQSLVVAQAGAAKPGVLDPTLVDLRAQMELARSRSRNLEDDLHSFAGRRVPWGELLSSIYSRTDSDVALSSVWMDGRRISVQGNAPTLDSIANYADRLRFTGLFSNVLIERVASRLTPLPGYSPVPTAPAAVPPSPTPTPRPPSPTPIWVPWPTPAPPPPRPAPPATWYPQPTWAPQPTPVTPPTWVPPPPTWAPPPTRMPPPTQTRYPTWTRVPPPPPTWVPPLPTRTPSPVAAVRLRNVVISPLELRVGQALRIEAVIDNMGSATLISQDTPPPSFTYDEGASAPPGMAGQWRIAADRQTFALSNNHRYRWGMGGNLPPGQSRRVVGYIRLTTPGTFTYCVGVVQEHVRWYASCEGATVVTVTVAPATPTVTPVASPTVTRTPTVCADAYEPDNTYLQARVIGANSSEAQRHTLHALGDADWVRFAVSPNITYTLRTEYLAPDMDMAMTLYGLDAGTLYALAQSPPLLGAPRISYRFTTTETTRFGSVFYAELRSRNPANVGCTKAYALRLTASSLAQRMGDERVALAGVTDILPADDRLLPILLAADSGRLDFTIIMDVR